MAGFGAYMKIDGFNIMPIRSFTMAITTFAGQNYGAGKGERVKKGMWITLAIGAIYTVITAVLLLTFSREMIGLFTKEPEVIRYGVLAMRYLCPFYAILSVMHMRAGVARGLGKTLPPMLILITAMCVLPRFLGADDPATLAFHGYAVCGLSDFLDSGNGDDGNLYLEESEPDAEKLVSWKQ